MIFCIGTADEDDGHYTIGIASAAIAAAAYFIG